MIDKTESSQSSGDTDSLDYPRLVRHAYKRTRCPEHWQCTALLHPFALPTDELFGPFYELCIARVVCRTGKWLSINLRRPNGQSVWYKTIASSDGVCRTTQSIDGGNWEDTDLNWQVPDSDWPGCDEKNYVGTGPLNWLNTEPLDWYKVPLSTVDGNHLDTACWLWTHRGECEKAGPPFRMMFGSPPADLLRGQKNRLALFQMYSFSYLFDYTFEEISDPPEHWQWPGMKGVEFYPSDLQRVVWKEEFGMTAMMTSCRADYDPIPTQVLYRWRPDSRYGDDKIPRAQRTLMQMTYNSRSPYLSQTDYLYGHGPNNHPAGVGYLLNQFRTGERCYKHLLADGIPIGQQPPDWMSSVDAKDKPLAQIVAKIDNEALGAGAELIIYAVTFPCTDAYPEYTNGRYLWTWYSPKRGTTGASGRPVTFMESASDVREGGTGLALADYFDYGELEIPNDLLEMPVNCPKCDQGS